MTETPLNEADKWLLGGGTPWAKFETYGDTVTGTIAETPTVRNQRDMDTGEEARWPDGSVITEMVIILATSERDPAIEDDTGRRQFVVNSAGKKQALRDAVGKARVRGLAVGGTLTVRYTHDAEPKKRGYRGQKQYAATYAPPPATEVPVDSEPDNGEPPF